MNKIIGSLAHALMSLYAHMHRLSLQKLKDIIKLYSKILFLDQKVARLSLNFTSYQHHTHLTLILDHTSFMM